MVPSKVAMNQKKIAEIQPEIMLPLLNMKAFNQSDNSKILITVDLKI